MFIARQSLQDYVVNLFLLLLTSYNKILFLANTFWRTILMEFKYKNTRQIQMSLSIDIFFV